MHSRFIVCAVALTLGATAQLSYGQGRARGHVVPSFLQEMDVNHDGIVTRAEWTGTAASFRIHDWNDDGMLSGDELRIGRGRGHQTRREAEEFDSGYREYEYTDWTAEGFAALDHNRDNRITRDEWHFARDSFLLADHDHNGWLSRAEFLGED